MTARLPRGACPSLSTPMPTGDGLLVRLTPPEPFDAEALAGLAALAERFGNGLVEVTSKGSLQVRGLSERSAPGFAQAVVALGLGGTPGPVVLTGPLAGLDGTETADPRPLAAAIRLGAAAMALHPKIAVVVDGGGAVPLDTLAADVRLVAEADGWHLLAGERTLGLVAEPAEAALALLARLAETGGRGRDLGLGAPSPAPPRRAEPVGRFVLRDGRVARAVALAFGLATATTLEAIAAAADGATIRPALGGALFVIGLAPDAETRLLAAAARLGLVIAPDDPRRAVSACSGWPVCGAGHLATRLLATRIAGRLPEGVRVHVSGCDKLCGRPAGPLVTVVGTARGPETTAVGPGARRVAAALERAMAEGTL